MRTLSTSKHLKKSSRFKKLTPSLIPHMVTFMISENKGSKFYSIGFQLFAYVWLKQINSSLPRFFSLIFFFFSFILDAGKV